MVRLILGKNRIDRLFELDDSRRFSPETRDDILETYFLLFRIEKKISTENLTLFPG